MFLYCIGEINAQAHANEAGAKPFRSLRRISFVYDLGIGGFDEKRLSDDATVWFPRVALRKK